MDVRQPGPVWNSGSLRQLELIDDAAGDVGRLDDLDLTVDRRAVGIELRDDILDVGDIGLARVDLDGCRRLVDRRQQEPDAKVQAAVEINVTPAMTRARLRSNRKASAIVGIPDAGASMPCELVVLLRHVALRT